MPSFILSRYDLSFLMNISILMELYDIQGIALMNKYQLKIHSVCIPFSFFPVPRSLLCFLYQDVKWVCSENHVLLYVLTSSNKEIQTLCFASFEQAKKKYKELNSENYPNEKITNLKLSLPQDWFSHFDNESEPDIEYPYENDFESTKEMNTHKEITIAALLKLRKSFISEHDLDIVYELRDINPNDNTAHINPKESYIKMKIKK